MAKPTVLLEDGSPNGNISAIVEQDERVAYFYLWPAKETGLEMRSCWIRNLAAGPNDLDAAAMRDGRPPMMPLGYCAHQAGAPPLKPELLRVVWSEEGDAAALYEQNDLLAVIPCWSGTDGFHGFSRECIGQGPLAWELGSPDDNVLFERFERASDYWKSWQEGALWPAYRDAMLQSLESAFGKHSKYFATDEGKWPPKALVQFTSGERIILATIGMSLRPQPMVELYVEEPRDYRRIELAMCLPSAIDDAAVQAVAQYLSGQSGYPWHYYTWLGNGHTIPADVFSELSGKRFPFALLSKRLPELPQLRLPTFRDDPVSILWLAPISKKEQEFAESEGSESLMQRLTEAKISCSALFSRNPLQV
jgi:hypothetical protein